MSNLTVCTLGTASQAPNVKRALNSVVLRADKGQFLWSRTSKSMKKKC